MAGRACVREEGLFLRNYHYHPMNVHVPRRAIDEERSIERFIGLPAP